MTSKEKDKILDILIHRIHLKDSTLIESHCYIDDNGLPFSIPEDNPKEVEVAFIEASGFVFKNDEEYELLKKWLEEKPKSYIRKVF